ncbi:MULTISPECIES: ABC transporter substrate-binding protein [unclassified Arthrobacter]|uniref:ABC transporter substrate-binding protein n=1 Tax=unclassified Arthrobacter TaxID=235627 RepID=UPI002105112F|nr:MULTISPECIES: ABC transporter substrate-binding protein [unclassified Arthrobacter]MCQ1946301.1 ABC transporter substrate-binding protein [Arthrobacter sp. zg-Y1116]MCQ1986242.1 ABC transporter substrate-binding protein [Arthrobacter sp. zg-Y844]MCQ1994019.1 ABC transporter substrate-binding protein [Arthrobacter sp. zg-Y1171]UWX81870.1 ABC transporter substrate-binding protein [Arthrobacter sp. zg-Y1171]
MPQSVDVGSVLGGRYKVTALVLASAEQDMVLDGVDQVLNRSVSILVAAPMNASQVSASAREIATGERHGNVQVLDLGVSDGRTYLITNTASAADLLDLVIERDAPYVEPFFTDTLGSEIFGMPRSREPETVEEDRYVEHEEREPRKPLLSGSHKPKLPRFGRNAAAAGAGAAAGTGAGAAAAERDLQFGEAADAPAEAATGGANVPPAPTTRPKQSAAEARPAKVTKWEDDEPQSAPVPERNSRSASTFPKSALAAGGYDDDGYGYGDPDDDYEEDSAEEKPNRKSGRVLIGAVLSLVLVLAVVLAVSQLGKMGDIFGSDPEAGASTAPTQEAAQAAPSADAAAPAPAPEIAGITRLVPGNPQLDSANDGALPQIIDGNPSSYWSSYVYASDTFGGLAPSLALVVDLGADSAVNEVNITQLNGTGGSFSVMLNDTPDLEGATSVAQSGFTGPTTSIPVPKTDGQAATARYVIVNFTQLPRLNGVQAAYPWGLRIAEIGVS